MRLSRVAIIGSIAISAAYCFGVIASAAEYAVAVVRDVGLGLYTFIGRLSSKAVAYAENIRWRDGLYVSDGTGLVYKVMSQSQLRLSTTNNGRNTSYPVQLRFAPRNC